MRILLFVGLLLAPVVVRAEATAATEREITDDERDHWAYHPLAQVSVPSVIDPRWNRNPVDAFVKSMLEEKGLRPLPAVGRATLLRRVTLDLTGLPPTPPEIQAFLEDDRPDAYEQVVERLLASSAYGERWAQHWLDLARFAESDGFEHDLVRPNAWRYREWVIDALNRDLPYDEFLRMQIAGDEIRPGDPQAAIATGFLLCGPDMPDINLQEERRHFVLNEMTATVGSAFLGLQFGCAQCHDHKYDPITLHDFYQLRAFFESIEIFKDHPIPSQSELANRAKAEAAIPAEIRAKQKRHHDLLEIGRARFREKNPDIRPSEKQALAELSKGEQVERAAIDKEIRDATLLPPLTAGRVVREGKRQQARLYLRGDFRQPGPVVQCSFPSVLGEDHPLVLRVIVNRLWQWHFGRGLVYSASDFGIMGYAPTHPALLDWLAARFVQDGWSFKAMHRLLVTSETYRLACGPYDASWSEETAADAEAVWEHASGVDPENEHLWRRDRQRLDGESIRDAMLFASERLSSR
jgi:hypothetical protein